MQSRETFCSGTDLGFGCKLWEAATGRGEAGASQCQSGKSCDFLHLKKVSFLSFKSKQQFCSIHIRMYIVMSELCHRMKAKWDELTSKLHRHRWENLSKIAKVLSFDHPWPWPVRSWSGAKMSSRCGFSGFSGFLGSLWLFGFWAAILLPSQVVLSRLEDELLSQLSAADPATILDNLPLIEAKTMTKWCKKWWYHSDGVVSPFCWLKN